MIERLNFYDLYGYLIPGLALVILLWLPFGYSAGGLPSTAWTSALLAVAVGYIAGHLIQRVARYSYWRSGEVPSAALLDPANTGYSPMFRELLFRRIQERFRITVPTDKAKQTRPIQNDAFMLCRGVLLNVGKIHYAEQFEGLYAMMRGLGVAFSFGIFYYLGIFVSDYIRSRVGFVAGHVSLAVIVLVWWAVSLRRLKAERIDEDRAKKRSRRNRYVIAERLAFVIVAGMLGVQAKRLANLPDYARWISLGATGACVLFALKCHEGFVEWSQLFATTVYRDFVVVETQKAHEGWSRETD